MANSFLVHPSSLLEEVRRRLKALEDGIVGPSRVPLSPAAEFYHSFSMANSFVGIDEPAVIDKKIDTEQLVIGANTVERERMEIAGAAELEIARILNALPSLTDYGLVTRPLLNNRTASGALGALNAAVTLAAEGMGAVNWEIDTGTLVGTVVFEATLDDTNWFAINAMRVDGTIISSTTTFADRGVLTSNGYSQVRLRVSAFTSGTSNGRLEGSLGASTVRLGQALPPGTNNIGDVDVLTLPALVAGTANIGDIDIASPLGGGTEAAAVRVTIANDSTGLVSVDDNAGSLTVDAPVGTPVATRLSDGVAFIDPRDVSDRAARLVGQVEGRAAHGVAVAGNPGLIAGRANANEPTAVADGQATSLWADLLGRLIVVDGHPSPEAPVTVNKTTTASSVVIAAPGVSLSLYIQKGSIHNTGAENKITLLDGATARWVANCAADGGGSLFDFGARGWKLAANTALNATASIAGDVDINVTQYYIAA